MNDPDAKQARELFDKYREYFVEFEEKNINRQALTRILISMMGDVKRKKVLDVGCGVGKECKVLSKNGAKVIGIDISPKMIELARKHSRNQDIKFFVMDMERTNFADNEFDVIFASFSVLFKENLKNVLSEFHRILKKQGELYLLVRHPVRKMLKYGGNYFETGKHWQSFNKMKFFNYYRIIEDYVNDLVSQGFIIKEIKEPMPEVKDEKVGREFSYPHSLIIKSVK